MLVETYEITELNSDGKIDDFEQVKALADKLGLEGQKQLLNPEKKEISPYRLMTGQENLIYETLLEQRTNLKNYSDSAIPLRVLQVASHVVELGICDEIEVWHKPSMDIKDPLLVGVKKDGWSRKYYILARWGDILLPFNELCGLVKKIIASKLRQKANEGIEALKSINTESRAEQAVLTGTLRDINIFLN